MIKLCIKNFGPIKTGYNNPQTDDFFSILRCTVIIGEQGTGKSTIAKLISTLLWLEKDIIQKRRLLEKFTTDDFIKLCKNQKINDYFLMDTYICCKTRFLTFEYKNSSFFITKNEDFDKYAGKKIMYIPSERNFISVLDEVDDIGGLPYTIESTYEEFSKASRALGKTKKKLPLNGFSYFYDKTIKTGFIEDEENNSVVKLSDSSSGLQSFTPLFLITDYLSKKVTEDFFNKIKNFSPKDKEYAKKLIQSHFSEIFSDKAEEVIEKFERAASIGLSSDFTESDKTILMSQLSSILNICFANIVEEPEQNLYPNSQIEVIKVLISCMNENVRNSLLITTHSPFILSTINNLLYASKINSKNIEENYKIDGKNCCAYLCKNGSIIDIFDRDNQIIDTTVIDDCATLLNQQFDDLYNEEVSNAE